MLKEMLISGYKKTIEEEAKNLKWVSLFTADRVLELAEQCSDEDIDHYKNGSHSSFVNTVANLDKDKRAQAYIAVDKATKAFINGDSINAINDYLDSIAGDIESSKDAYVNGKKNMRKEILHMMKNYNPIDKGICEGFIKTIAEDDNMREFIDKCQLTDEQFNYIVTEEASSLFNSGKSLPEPANNLSDTNDDVIDAEFREVNKTANDDNAETTDAETVGEVTDASNNKSKTTVDNTEVVKDTTANNADAVEQVKAANRINVYAESFVKQPNPSAQMSNQFVQPPIIGGVNPYHQQNAQFPTTMPVIEQQVQFNTPMVQQKPMTAYQEAIKNGMTLENIRGEVNKKFKAITALTYENFYDLLRKLEQSTYKKKLESLGIKRIDLLEELSSESLVKLDIKLKQGEVAYLVRRLKGSKVIVTFNPDNEKVNIINIPVSSK